MALGPAPAWAFHPLLSDDTGTQGAGGNQLELGYDYDRSVLDGVTDIGHSSPLTYTRGVSDRLDLFVGTTRLSHPVSGWSNVGVGAKWRFYDNEMSGFSLALEPKIGLPVSKEAEERGLGTSKTCYSLALLLTQTTGFGQLIANLVAGRDDSGLPENAGNRKNWYQLSVAPVWQAGEAWRLALDMGLMTNPDRSQNYTMGFVEAGAVYSPSKAVDLSLGVIRNIMDGPLQNTTVTSEVTWHF